MMRQWWPVILVVLISPFLIKAQDAGKIDRIALFEKDVLILGEGRKGPYFLPDSLIIKDSESVYIDRQLQARAAYQINYIDGEIRFINSVPQGAKIRLIYKLFPYPIRKQYAHRSVIQRLLGSTTETISPLKTAKSEGEIDYAAQLNKSGSITRGVTVGTDRSLKVNSSLNINVSGKVADNVEVVAALTDQSTPIQPEGTTQNLQEIDKVFVQLKSPHFGATLGDYNLELPSSQFARYSRKLQGAMGTAQFSHFQFTASGAVSRGKYISQSFSGEEGNQGPYQLKGDRGQIDIIVLAGTERVYIDGESMVRGETNDYVIDYAAAQITFTRRRLITADSRIVVDFQYSDEKYRRSLYSAQGMGEMWDRRIKVMATFLRESDDKDNPLDFTLSEERLAILRAAGDDPQKAIVDGAAYVGPGNGRYVMQDSGIFRYVGPDSGDYRVTFSDVGQDLGSYAYKGGGIYEYVGIGAGRYAPVILLPTARNHHLFDFDVQLQPIPALKVSSEIAISTLDVNAYSPLDDQDNQGTAQEWKLQFLPDTLHVGSQKLGVVGLSARYRSIGDRFRDMDRTTEIEYNRRWNLPETTPRGERVRELEGHYNPFQGFSLTGEYGDIKKGDYFQSERWQLDTGLMRHQWPEYQYRIEHIKNKNITDVRMGDWWRQKGAMNWRIWKLKPLFGYEGEIKKENWSDTLYSGLKFNSWTGGLEVNASKKLFLSARYAWRNDQDYVGPDQFLDKSTAKTQQAMLRLQQLGALSASIEYTHRQRTFTDSSLGRKDTDLAEVRAFFKPWKNAVNMDLNYQISNTATAKKERVYIKVSPGEGNYRFDPQLKEYVSDPLGDYILRVLTTDELVPVIELKTSTRLRLEPAKFYASKNKSTAALKSWQKWLRALSSESFIAIEERTQEDEIWSIYLLNLNRFQKQNVTMFGTMQFRQDFYVFEHNRDFSLRLRYTSRDEMNNQYLEGGQKRKEREYNLRMTNRFFNKWSSQSEINHKQLARSFFGQDKQNRDIYSNQIRFDLVYRPKQRLELALESRLSSEEDRFYSPATKVLAFSFLPRFVYSFLTKGRWQAELEWSRVDVKPGNRLLPYEMANGRSPGSSLRWDVRFDYRVSKTIQASLSYGGRSEPERQGTIHTGRAQITAAFR
ncbi:hypothetical protein JXO59_06285 [candidate division KSB1 bacterium]|nr:hypothetical protein [candidate division KSB1 bacterium]